MEQHLRDRTALILFDSTTGYDDVLRYYQHNRQWDPVSQVVSGALDAAVSLLRVEDLYFDSEVDLICAALKNRRYDLVRYDLTNNEIVELFRAEAGVFSDVGGYEYPRYIVELVNMLFYSQEYDLNPRNPGLSAIFDLLKVTNRPEIAKIACDRGLFELAEHIGVYPTNIECHYPGVYTSVVRDIACVNEQLVVYDKIVPIDASNPHIVATREMLDHHAILTGEGIEDVTDNRVNLNVVFPKVEDEFNDYLIDRYDEALDDYLQDNSYNSREAMMDDEDDIY